MNSISLFFSNLTKGKKLALLLAPILTLLLSMKAILLGLFILIIIDLITGIVKSLKEQNIKANVSKKLFWKSIKSYLLRKTWKKAYEYGLGIIVIVVFETLVFGSTSILIMSKSFTISELAVIIPAIIEIWSIFENIEAVSKNNVLKKLTLFFPAPLRNLFKKAKSIKEENNDV